jgi:hypothetical protein
MQKIVETQKREAANFAGFSFLGLNELSLMMQANQVNREVHFSEMAPDVRGL